MLKTKSPFKATLLLLILPALYPLFRPGFFVSDDGRFHVYRVAALARAWRAGVLHPRLFPEFGFGYGQEVLNFYAPLSYWPGAFLSALGMNPAAAVKVTMGMSLLLAALAMFFYVRDLWGPAAGIVSAILYTYYPYHLTDAFQRGAMPELAAFIFFPLILWMTTRIIQAEESAVRQRAWLWHTLAWAGLVFTHNLSAMLMALVIIPYALLLAWHAKTWQRLWSLSTSLMLALALTAVYWLPVLAESAGMGLRGGPSRGYENHLLPLTHIIAHTFSYDYQAAYTGPAVHPQNWFALTILALTTLLLIWRWQHHRPAHTEQIIFHLLLAAAAIFMTTTSSLPIWHPLTPLLGFLQYPWRFLSLAAVGIAVSGGSLIPLIPHPKLSSPPAALSNSVIAVIFLLALLTSLPKLPHQSLTLTAADAWFPQRMWQEDAEVGQIGATWTGEFLPRSVTEQRWALGRPREGAKDTSPLPGPPQAEITAVKHMALSLNLNTPAEMPLRLHQFQAPGWHANIDGQPAAMRASTELGLVTADVYPAGQHEITFTFGSTPARVLGAWLSALAALIWSLIAWKQQQRAAALILLLATTILMLNSAGIGQKSHTPAPVQAQVGDVAQILAADVQPASLPGYLEVTLYWLAQKENATDYNVFIHVLDGAGQVVAQHDGYPVGGFTPTTRWRAGEIIPDTYHISLPPELLPGVYHVKVGMYAPADVIQNLTITPAQPDNRVDVGAVQLP